MDTAVHFPTTPKAVTAKKLKLTRRMDVETAFAAIMGNCLQQIKANEEGVSKFQTVDCLHQMRVGLRRMRSALGMFEDVLSLPESLQVDLDWLVGELGPARDWDVLAGTTLAAVEDAMPGAEQLAALKSAALSKTSEFHQSAALAVESNRYTHFIEALESWVAERGWRQALVPGDKTRLKARVADFARAILAKDQQRLLKRGKHLSSATPEARHRVRIAAKKTRYAAEFFGSLYTESKVRPYVKALSGLQDELGWMNDGAVAERLLAELTSSDAALHDSAAYVRGYLAGRMHDGKSSLQRNWKKFTGKRMP